MTTCKRGDVVLTRWPDVALSAGKFRPALVVQVDGLTTGLSQVIVAGITGNLARGGPPFRIALPHGSTASRGTGLRSSSVVMVDNLLTVHLRDIDRVLGRLADMMPVDAALRVVFGL